MPNHKSKDLQDWIDVLQGKNVKDIDPKTKIEAKITSRKVVKFKPSLVIKNKLNGK